MNNFVRASALALFAAFAISLTACSGGGSPSGSSSTLPPQTGPSQPTALGDTSKPGSWSYNGSQSAVNPTITPAWPADLFGMPQVYEFNAAVAPTTTATELQVSVTVTDPGCPLPDVILDDSTAPYGNAVLRFTPQTGTNTFTYSKQSAISGYYLLQLSPANCPGHPTQTGTFAVTFSQA
jgi:hypothetical protein